MRTSVQTEPDAKPGEPDIAVDVTLVADPGGMKSGECGREDTNSAARPGCIEDTSCWLESWCMPRVRGGGMPAELEGREADDRDVDGKGGGIVGSSTTGARLLTGYEYPCNIDGAIAVDDDICKGGVSS